MPAQVWAAAARRPAAVAVRSAGQELSYGDLVRQAGAVAQWLHAAGIAAGRGTVVGVCAHRSPELVVGLLGVLAAGAAYQPLDPAHPATRRAALLADTAAPVLLTTADLAADAPPGVRVLLLDELAPTEWSPLPTQADDLAYVIHTSGSTGRPKGVQVTHGGLANLVQWTLRATAVTEDDRATLLAGIGFDASVWELWPYLAAGATVVVVDDATRAAPAQLRDFLVRERVTVSFAPTVLAEQLLALDWPAETALRVLHTGGEALHRRPPASMPFRLVNNYGPAECTVVAMSGIVHPSEDPDLDTVPSIGRPIDGIEAHVLDRDLRPAPPGAAGELFLGGAGLARGYAGRPDLTAERFVPNPFAPGARLYRTGDVVRVRPDGAFDFVGRVDDQVKIRGHRIEPGEIEAALAGHPSVSAAVVVARRSGAETVLAAYCVPSNGHLDTARLREHLRTRLPATMVPRHIVALDAFPVTPNGKVDRSALPTPDDQGTQRRSEPPRTATEIAVAAIWQEVLGLEHVGRHDAFDELGGHSLRAAQIAGRIAARLGAEVSLSDILGGATVADLAGAVDKAERTAEGIPRRDVNESVPRPLTAAQRRLWFLHEFALHPTLYTDVLAFDLRGPVDPEALRRTLDAIVTRHEPLRTRIVDTPDGPRQVAGPTTPIGLPVVSAGRPIREIAAELASQPFDLARDVLLRAVLVQADEETAQLLLAVHHIAFDGWSVGVLVRELGGAHPELPIRVADVADWEAGQPREGLREYWRTQLAGASMLALPADNAAPAKGRSAGRTIRRPLPAAPEFTTALAALACGLQRWTGQSDVLIGTPVANRARPELEPLIGCFVNTLPLRCDLTGDPTFGELRARLSGFVRTALAHQALPFDEMLDPATPPLQVMLVVQQAPPGPVQVGSATLTFAEQVHLDTAQFDLTVVVEFVRGKPALSLQYDADLFSPATAQALLDQLGTLLAAAVAAPDTPIGALPLDSAEEQRRVLALGRGPVTQLPTAAAHTLFERQAARTPDAVAVTSGGQTLTYRQLDERANGLAWQLRAAGVGPEVPVAVCAERGLTPVVGMLAVLKAGGVYVPLDPAYPDERLGHALGDLTAPVVLATATQADRMRALRPDAPTVPADDAAPSATAPPDEVADRDGAYIIYTSGSTGRPKGVLIEHRSLVNVVLAKIERFAVPADGRVLQYVSFGFGVSISDVLMTLAAGATLVVRGPEVLAGPDLVEFVRAERITNLVLPASILASMPTADLPAVRAIAVGGEPCPRDVVERWSAGRHFVEAYGTTETAICSTTNGRPLPNTEILVLDARCRPAPPGVPGDLYIGGMGVGRAYIGRPELTADRFVAHPCPTPASSGGRVYRTGDLARWRSDGTLQWLGRADDQVQLRGVRVEIGEVEAALRRAPGVAEAAAAVHPHPVAGQQLVGYMTGAPPTDEALRKALRSMLPDAMVPAAFVRLPALPRTGSGKLDRRALPAPTGADTVSRAATTATEKAVAAIWAEVLGVAQIGATDDFFALGGQSLLAAQVMARVRERFGVSLPVRTLFDAPIVAALAGYIDDQVASGDAGAAAVVVQRPRPAGAPAVLSSAQRRLWFLQQMTPQSAAYNIPVAWRLRGRLDVPALVAALRDVVSRHEILRTTYGNELGRPVPQVQTVEQFVIAADGADAARPFALDRELPVRASLVETGPDEHVLALTFHHIAVDGWSIGLLANELAERYVGRQLPAPAAQYADAAHWQHQQLQGEQLAALVDYWRERLAGAPPVLDLAPGKPRSAQPNSASGAHRFRIDATIAGAVRALARTERTTTFVVMLAAVQTLCARLTGQRDIVVGTPVAGRPEPWLEGVVGCFVNTMAVRTTLSDECTGRELVRQVRADVLADTDHADLPFERLVEELAPGRLPGRTPICQVMFAATNVPRSPLTLPGVDVTELAAAPGGAKFDVNFSIDDIDGQLAGMLTYRQDLFTAAEAADLAARYAAVLEEIAVEPDRPVVARTVLDLIDRHVRATPDAPAVAGSEAGYTYRQLDERARQLAYELRAQGAGPDTPVALLAERTPDAVVGLLGIMRAGAAYVPIDPRQPPARIQALLDSAGISIVVTPELLAGLHSPAADQPAPTQPLPHVRPESLAYVIFTSGSTGAPKAVAIEQRHLFAYVRSINERLAPPPGSAFGLVSTLAADLGHTSLFTGLCAGGVVHVLGPELASDADALAGYLQARPVDYLKVVPSHLAALLEAAQPADVLPKRCLVSGGEALSWALVERVRALSPGLAILNHYGPTETTVGAVAYDVPLHAVEHGAGVPIGRPLPHATAHVLDGELYLGGAAVARGYLGDPALTAERFRPDPFSDAPGARLYRTGDRVRQDADGVLHFLGRVDDQVQIRGYRVEPAEVAAALRALDGVGDVHVRPWKPDGDHDRDEVALVAYAVTIRDPAELRRQLADRLPPHLVPAHIVALDRLPLTANGKVDRAALPAPAPAERGGGPAAQTTVETAIATIWADVLGRGQPAVTDDFFALGGHSLLAMQVVARIRRDLGVELPVHLVFERPTVGALAEHIENLSYEEGVL